MLKNLWNDEAGALIAAEFILVATILVIGLVTGLTSVRDAVITELADVGAAIGSINQSYSYGGSTAHCAAAAGSTFDDQTDFCDGAVAQDGCNSRCVTICTAGTGESAHD
jgi:Flp pilus assembly pilin Flp